MDNLINSVPNIEELSDRADRIYRDIPDISEYDGKYIAIDVDSKKYFIGDTRDVAVANAKAKFPSKLIFVRRIGQIEKISRHVAPYMTSRGNGYARIF